MLGELSPDPSLSAALSQLADPETNNVNTIVVTEVAAADAVDGAAYSSYVNALASHALDAGIPTSLIGGNVTVSEAGFREISFQLPNGLVTRIQGEFVDNGLGGTYSVAAKAGVIAVELEFDGMGKVPVVIGKNKGDIV